MVQQTDWTRDSRLPVGLRRSRFWLNAYRTATAFAHDNATAARPQCCMVADPLRASRG